MPIPAMAMATAMACATGPRIPIIPLTTILGAMAPVRAEEPVLSERMRDLMARMTLDEKIGQLGMLSKGARYDQAAA